MLFVEETGPEAAESIVFLHGGGGAGWMWQPQVEALGGEYHVIVPDLPGQGRSGGTFSMAIAAAEVARLIRERAHGGSAHVVGLSEGAQTLVQLLATEPDVVRTALVSSALVRPLPGAGWLSRPAVLGMTYAVSVAPLRDSERWIRLNMRAAAGVPDAYFEPFSESFRGLSKEGFVALMHANQTFRLPDGLSPVRSRVLAVCGRREYSAMKRSALDIANAIPGARACEVVHAGKMSVAQEHNWNMNAPELFNEMVRAFIADETLPSALVPLGPESGGAQQ